MPFFLLAIVAGLPFVTLFNSAHAESTLEKVKKQKILMCGIGGGLPGFSNINSKGQYEGLDVDICKAIAAAVGVEVRFKELSGTTRFPALQSGEIDVLVRNTTFTMSRDTKLAFESCGTNYYDGQGFLVSKALKVKSARELKGASVCVQAGTTTEMNLNDWFKTYGIKFKAVVFEKFEDANKAYAAGRCDAYSTDASGLAAVRAGLKNPTEHIILPEIISKEPLGPLVRQDDAAWGDIVRWTLNALITAEEKGITQANVTGQSNNTDPEVGRLLGFTGTLGADAGLTKDWAVKAIAAVGNYSEIFERNLGPKTPLKIERGLNALWNKGGLIYSPPFN